MRVWGLSPRVAVVLVALLPSLMVALVLAVAFAAGYIGALYRELWAAPAPLATATPMATPAPVAASAPLALNRAPDAEPAWPRYFAVQAFADARLGWSEGWDGANRALDAVWQRLRDWVLERENLGIRWLFILVAAAGVFISIFVGSLLAVAVAAAHWLVAGALVAGSSLVGALLWAGDWAFLRLNRVQTTCPSCYQEIACPIYACRSCGRKHRDIRPGRYGLLRRGCLCAERLPTRVARAGRTLEASCPNPNCGKQLPKGAGAARELTIAMVGPTGAGKTRLAFGMVMALEGAFVARQEPVLLTDDTRERYHELQAAIIRDEPIPETKSAPQAGLSLHVKPNRRRGRVIHIFDAAGAWFHSREDRGLGTEVLNVHDLRYLRRARSFVYVIDPLGIDELWEGLPPKLQDRLLKIRPERTAPAWRTFEQTLGSLRDMGVHTRWKLLAVAVSKADKLEGRFPLDAQAGNDSGQVAAGLSKLGLGSLVRTAGRFQPRFFHTAVTLDRGQMHHSVVELTNWVIPSRGGWIP
jgi:hypothetical protein